MDEAGKKLEHVENLEGGRRARIAGSDNRLLLVGWDRLLRLMADAAHRDSSTASDIRQLRDLARRQDDEAFQPIHREELAPSLARRIRSINQLIDNVIDSGHEKLGITTKGYKAQPQREVYGRYFEFRDVDGWFFFGIHFGLWATRSDTPIWLRIGETSRCNVEELYNEFPLTQQEKDKKYVPIELKTGEESQAVFDDIVSQIEKIKNVFEVTSFLEGVDPAPPSIAIIGDHTIRHPLCNDLTHLIRRLDEVPVGKVSVTGCGPVPPVPEQAATRGRFSPDITA